MTTELDLDEILRLARSTPEGGLLVSSTIPALVARLRDALAEIERLNNFCAYHELAQQNELAERDALTARLAEVEKERERLKIGYDHNLWALLENQRLRATAEAKLAAVEAVCLLGLHARCPTRSPCTTRRAAVIWLGVAVALIALIAGALIGSRLGR